MSDMRLTSAEIQILLRGMQEDVGTEFTSEQRVDNPEYKWAYYIGSKENPKRLYIASDDAVLMHQIHLYLLGKTITL